MVRAQRAQPPGHPGYVSGLWYPGLSPGTTNGGLGLNSLFLSPIFIGAPVTIDRLAVSVQTGAVGNARVGMYRANPDGTFTKIAINTANMATDAAADLQGSFSSNLFLSPGFYAGALALSATTTMRCSNGTMSGIAQVFGSTTVGGALTNTAFSAGAFMALAYSTGDFFPASIASASLTRASGAVTPTVAFRVA